jgi:hypothetical protein
MNRITEKDLEATVAYLNRLTNSPDTPYTRIDNKLNANIGNYHLSHAYGGVKLHRMVNEGGGVREPISTGYTTKRDLYNQLHAFIRGLEVSKEVNHA